MKFAIDKIENNIALLENIETGEKREVSITDLPSNIKESNILIYQNNIYIRDLEEESRRKESIIAKFNRLKKR